MHKNFSVYIVILLAFLTSSCQHSSTLSPTRQLHKTTKPICIVIDWPGYESLRSDPESLESFLKNSRKLNITHLLLEAKSSDGVWRLDQYTQLREVGEKMGIHMGATYPMFIPNSDKETEFPLQAHGAWKENGYTVRPGAEMKSKRLSVSSPMAFEQTKVEIEKILDDPSIELVLLTGFGYTASTSDISPSAKTDFESWYGGALKDWPEAVLGAKPPAYPTDVSNRGPYWPFWVRWRAENTLNHAVAIRAQAVTHAVQPAPILGVLVDAPYVMHQREGLNWASARKPLGSNFPWLDPGYSSTAAGHLFDAIALGYWRPDIVSAEEAKESSFAWWGSIEGSSLMAQQVKTEQSSTWGVIPVQDDYPWERGLVAASRLNDGLVLLNLSSMLSSESWDQ